MAERERFFALLLAAALILGTAPPAAAKEYCERLYDAAKRDTDNLLASDRKQKFRESWDLVMRKYAEIADRFPGCSQAPAALYNLGDLYRRLYRRAYVKEDLERSRKAFDRLVRSYPQNSLADDALLAQADVLETMGRKSDAYLVLTRLLELYPRGDMRERAKAKLADLSAFSPEIKTPRQATVRPTAPATVQDIRIWSNPSYTRVIVYTSGYVAPRPQWLPADEKAGKPPRLYLDLTVARLSRGLSAPKPVGDGLLRQVRFSQHDADTVRVVLDIDNVEDHLIFPMENPYRVIVDVAGRKGQLSRTAAAGRIATADTSRQPLSLARQLGLGVKRIVLDPGHGGADPGALGAGGLQEKEVNLAITRKLKSLLEGKGYQVALTRDSDVFLRLEDRPAIAENQRADLFISIHCNANRNRGARGIATYFLGVAKDRESSEAAMLENAISENTLGDVERILLDLARDINLQQSSVLAEKIQGNICREVRCRYSAAGEDIGVKQAPFYVLVGARMPAILVEASFISNPEEERLLADPAYQELLAQAIAGGVGSYVEELAPTAYLEQGPAAPAGAASVDVPEGRPADKPAPAGTTAPPAGKGSPGGVGMTGGGA